MLNILTVCGNGIGSSLMAKEVVKKICEEEKIDASVNSADVTSANLSSVDLAISVPEILAQLTQVKNKVAIRSYVSEKKIREDIVEILHQLNK
ncbi:MAG: PTS sugar transporter subunit IIB [Brevinema sp.]